MTISDLHLAPNKSRQSAQKSRESQEKRGKEAKKSPAEEGPEQLGVFSLTVTNNEQIPVRLNGSLPCEALNPNGVSVTLSGGIAEEQSETAKLGPSSSIWSQAKPERAYTATHHRRRARLSKSYAPTRRSRGASRT